MKYKTLFAMAFLVMASIFNPGNASAADLELFASATADCGNGISVSCSGENAVDCSAIPGWGCRCNDEDGKKVSQKNCPKK